MGAAVAVPQVGYQPPYTKEKFEDFREERLSPELEHHGPYKPRPPPPKTGEYRGTVVKYASTWEMTAALRSEICKTQQIYSNLNSSGGPRLTARNLQRCPVSLVRHLFVEISHSTGFGQGVFSADELNSCGISRERKIKFYKKLCTLVAVASNWFEEGLEVKVEDISSDPILTNRLLQRMHMAASNEDYRSQWEQANKAAAAVV